MSGTERELASGISDEELFAHAGTAETPEPAHDDGIADDIPAEVPAEAAPQPVAANTPSPQPEPAQPHRVPLSELLDEREKRQAAAREADEIRRQNAALQRQLEELRQPKAQPVDPFADPDAFSRSIEQRFSGLQTTSEMQRRQDIMSLSFDMASDQHGEKFTSALEEFAKAANPQIGGDEQLRSRMLYSPNPAKFVMQWHQQQNTLRETGGDIAAYRERVQNETRESLKSDPEFRRQLLEELRKDASSRPSTIATALPPSLTRTTSAAPQDRADPDDSISDRALFQHAMARKR